MKSFGLKVACVFIILMYCLAPLSALDLTQDDNNKYIGHDNGDSNINTKDVDVAKEQNDRQNKKLDDGNSAKEVDTDSIDNNNQDNVKSDNVKSENVKSDNVKAADDNGMEIGRADPKLTINVNDVQIGQKATAEIHAVKSFSGTVYVYLDNSYVPKPVSVKNGYGKVTLNELPAGKYSATVKYYGGLKYKADQSSTTFKVSKFDPNLKIDVDDVNIGEKATAKITADKSFSGIVRVYLEGSPLAYNVYIKNGYGQVSFKKLSTGTYTATVKYAGSIKYEADESSTTFSVNKFNPNLKINVDDIDYGEKATVKITADKSFSGTVYVSFHGDLMPHKVSVKNGYAELTIDEDLVAGKYLATVKFAGNKKFSPSQDSTRFTVHRLNPNLSIHVDDLKVGKNEIVTLKADKDFSGYIYVSFHGDLKPHKIYMKNGYAQWSFEEYLAAGKYVATAKFNGDEKFKPCQASTTFTVSKYDPNLSIDVDDIDYGEKAIARITADESFNGTVYVSFHGDLMPHKVSVKNGYAELTIDEDLLAGKYLATVKFAGDKKFSKSQDSTRFIVRGNPDLSIDVDDIDYGEKATVKITADKSFSGTVYVSFHGDLMPHKVSVKNGYAELTIDEKLAAGIYTATVKFAGSKKFSPSQDSTRFTVHRLNPNLSIHVDDLKVGKNEIITLKADKDFSGYVYVSFHGDLMPHKIYMKNGYAQWSFEEYLAAGKYVATAKFNGDEKFKPCQASTTFTVSKYNPNLSIHVDDIDYGEKAIARITADESFNGTVYVSFHGDLMPHKVYVKNGYAELTIDEDLLAGKYLATVKFAGDKKFSKSQDSTRFIVRGNPDLSINVDDIDYGEKATAEISAKKDFSGYVYVSFHGDLLPHKVFVKNGYAKVTIDEDLVAGNYTATVKFAGNKRFTQSQDSTRFTVRANLDPNLNIKVDDIYQGQKAVVVVTANETLNGEANIKLNNSNAVYPINITNGYASITLDENLTPGDYLATVTLFGDDTFKADESSTTFKVKEVLDPKLNIKVKDIGYGDKETVTVTTDDKFTGNVDVKIGTKNYNVKVVNGKGTIDVSGLKVGTYTAIATFKKTETFNASTKTAKFTVKKVSPKITANSKTFKYAQKTKSYSVSLKDNKGKAMKGQKVTLKVNGKTYSAKTNSKGVATFKITKLNKVGNNNAVITYAGDKSYNKVSKKAKITVKFDTLAPNSKNKAMVKELQRALKRNHFYIKYNGHRLLIDGWYHIFTTWAVKKYQEAKGLKVTGKVDYKTALKLKLI